MTKCEHWDAGWCYAPVDVKTNAIGKFGVCKLPEYCPYLKSQNQMNEIQQTKEDIAILQEKLKKLEELEIQKSKTPVERAFYRVYGYYPLFDTDGYQRFVIGYDAGYEEAVKNNKNFEPTPQTPEQVEQGLRDAMKQAKEDGVFDKPETLYDALDKLDRPMFIDDVCRVVEEWLPDEVSIVGYYDSGWNDAIRTTKDKLR